MTRRKPWPCSGLPFERCSSPLKLGRWEQDPSCQYLGCSPSSQKGQDLRKRACWKLGIHTETKPPLCYPLLRSHHCGPREPSQVLLIDKPPV